MKAAMLDAAEGSMPGCSFNQRRFHSRRAQPANIDRMEHLSIPSRVFQLLRLPVKQAMVRPSCSE